MLLFTIISYVVVVHFQPWVLLSTFRSKTSLLTSHSSCRFSSDACTFFSLPKTYILWQQRSVCWAVSLMAWSAVPNSRWTFEAFVVSQFRLLSMEASFRPLEPLRLERAKISQQNPGHPRYQEPCSTSARITYLTRCIDSFSLSTSWFYSTFLEHPASSERLEQKQRFQNTQKFQITLDLLLRVYSKKSFQMPGKQNERVLCPSSRTFGATCHGRMTFGRFENILMCLRFYLNKSCRTFL